MSADSTERADRSHLLRWVAAIVAVLLVGAVVALVGFRFLRRDRASTAGTAPAAAGEASDLLLVVGGVGETLPAMALLADTKQDPVVVLLPATTVVEDIGVGPRTLAATLELSGPDALAVALANKLRIRVPPVVVASAADAQRAVDAAGGLTVEVPQSVTTAGSAPSVFAAGPSRMDGERFVEFQTAPVEGAFELDRLIRQAAGWRSLLRALAEGPGAAQLRSWAGSSDRVTAGATVAEVADDPDVRSLPTLRAGFSNEDIYRIEAERLGPLRRTLVDFVEARTDEGRRLRLLVGAQGRIGPAVGRDLVNAGYHIVLSGPASRPYETTEVIGLPGLDDPQAAAERVVRVLGAGTTQVSDRRVSVVDIMLVVGKDWAEEHGFRQR